MACIAAAAVLLGAAALLIGSAGYTVYYDEAALGFVDEPETVLENLEEINAGISGELDAEATVYANHFRFEKGIRLFKEKNSAEEIALAVTSGCQPDVNVYDIYVDGVFVAQDNSIEGVKEAIAQLEQEYKKANPGDLYDELDFVQKFEVRISKAKCVERTDAEAIYAALDPLLTVKTKTFVYGEKAVPYEIVYEPTETKAVGEATVKIAGAEGLVETLRITEKHDGVAVASSEKVTKVINETVDQVVLVGTKGLTISDAGMASPSRGGVTSAMGSRWGRQHKGIDVDGGTGDPIYAAKEGTIITAEFKNNGYGNMIEIDHGNGLVTRYAHLNSISVAAGDKVYIGQVIGGMGSTGRSTGTHLHFEVLLNGANVNPLEYVNY